MNAKIYRKWKIGLTLGVAIGVSTAVTLNSMALALGTVIAGMMVMYVIKKRVTDIQVDERQVDISEKASRAAIGVFALATALVGMVIIVMREVWVSLTPVGFTLSYAAIGIMLLYNLFYWVYSKRM